MIGLHVKNTLTNNEAIKSLTKGRVYPLCITQGVPEYPFIMFDVQDDAPDYELDTRKAADNYTVTVYVAAKEYEQLCRLSRFVRKALELKYAEYDDYNVISATYIGGEQDYEDKSDSLVKIMQFAFTTIDNDNTNN